jgi:hypothetical protein
MITIGIYLESKPFNDNWPKMKIYHNNNLIDDIFCLQSQELHYQIEPDVDNLLSIEMYGKRFGDGGIYDVDSNGQGHEIKIKDITFDEVSIDHLMSKVEFETYWTEHQLSLHNEEFRSKYNKYYPNGLIVFNGRLNFNFSTPIYDFLIDKRYKVDHNKDIAYFSNSTELFNFQLGLSKLEEIKKIINEHD